jgi:hypothetical protein
MVVASITHTVDATMGIGCNHTAFYFVTLDATTYVWLHPCLQKSEMVDATKWPGHIQTVDTWMQPDYLVVSICFFFKHMDAPR